MKIEIGNKKFDVKVAKTEDEKIKGLQGVKSMSKEEGMLFVYEEPQEEIGFWMKDCLVPLDIVFIDEDYEVISVEEGIPGDEELIVEYDVQYVLEVLAGSGIEEGDVLELEEFKIGKLNPKRMYVLDLEGNPQMELESGERIFSRKNTKTLITIAKRAYSLKRDRDYKLLGSKIFEFLDIQDSNEPEFVESGK